MRKIRLDLDALDVVSFVTDTAAEPRGTVQGQARAAGTGPVDSCGGTCYDTSCDNACLCDPAALAAAAGPEPFQPAQHGSIEGGASCGASCYWICRDTEVC